MWLHSSLLESLRSCSRIPLNPEFTFFRRSLPVVNLYDLFLVLYIVSFVFASVLQLIFVANDITLMIGSFSPPEDMLFKVL